MTDQYDSREIGFIVAVILLIAASVSASPVVRDVAPLTGVATDTVVITGEGFDADTNPAVSLGGVTAAIASASETTLTVTVPEGVRSGDIVVTDDSGSTTFPIPFVALREITGQFQPPPGVTAADWIVATGDHLEGLGPDDAFAAVASDGLPTAVWVIGDENGSAFLGVVASGEDTLVIDETTTAVALLALNPATAPLDDIRLADIRALVNSHAGASELVSLIADIAAQGRDYLDDARVTDLAGELLLEWLGTLQTGEGASQPLAIEDTDIAGVWHRQVNPESPPTRFEAKLEPIPDSDRFTFEYALRKDLPNSLDWTMELLLLDPFDFPDGLATVDALSGLDTLIPMNSIPFAGGFQKASLETAKIDLFGWLFGEIQNLLLGPLDSRLKTNSFTLDKNAEGVYLLQAYSGNIPNGLNLQAGVLEAGDPNSQWGWSLASNTLVAVIDAASVAISFKSVIASEDIQALTSELLSMTKTFAVYRESNSLNAATFYDYIKSSIGNKVKKFLTDRLGDRANSADVARFSGKALRFMVRSVDILGKISSGAQAVERSANLVTEGTPAVDRSVIVVGDVFRPFIRRIENNRPGLNETITIRGGNFPPDPESLDIRFCLFGGTSGEPTAEIAATIVEGSGNFVRIRIPDRAEFREKFTAGEEEISAEICINDGVYEITSGRLGPEAGRVHLPAPPELLAANPDEIYAGGIFSLHGNGFAPDTRVSIDGTPVSARVIHEERILVFLTNTIAPGERSVVVAFADVESEALPIEILDPSHTPENLDPGVTINITKLDMSNAADGEISLLEAFLIAGGGLGRPIEQHDPCESIPEGQPGYCGGFRQRETDFVFGDDEFGVGGGPGVRDTIRIHFSLEERFAQASQTLAIHAGDSIDLDGMVLDGGNGGFDAFLLNGTADAEIRNVILQGYAGAGIRLQNEAKGNDLRFVTVRNVGGDGLVVDSGSVHNTFQTFEIFDAGGSALRVAQASRFNAFTGIQIDGAGAHGVVVSDGSDRNSFINFSILNAGLSESADGFGILNSGSNLLRNVEISEVNGNGLHLSGSGSHYNRVYRPQSPGSSPYILDGAVRDCSEWGVLLDQGASFNVIGLKFVSNSGGGVRITGLDTSNNTVGHYYRRMPSSQELEFAIFQIIADNDGPGIEVTDSAHENALVGLNIAGNGGDGIFLHNVDRTAVLSVLLGVHDFLQDVEPFAHPNGGNGIRLDGATETTIGNQVPNTFLTSSFRTRIFNEPGDGIRLENESDHNRIDAVQIGTESSPDPYEAVQGNGIRLASGSSENVLGNAENEEAVISIQSVPNSAVLLEGSGTDFNLIAGIEIGSGFSSVEPERLGGIGIHLRNGPKGNRIGRGDRNFVGQFGNLGHINRITNVADAGVVLDNAGGSFLNTEGRLDDPNLVQNNSIFNTGTGIRITGNASGNIVGGERAGTKGAGFILISEVVVEENNSISAFTKAGIHISGNVIGSEFERNRILNNIVSSNAPLPESLPDLATWEPEGVGLLIDGDSSGNLAGEDLRFSNDISAPFAAFVDGGSGNTVRGNNFGNPFSFNTAIGAVLRDTTDTVVGGRLPSHGNTIEGAGSEDLPESAGILVLGGRNNSIQGNVIRDNTGDGIRVDDSPDNLLGGPHRMLGNQIFRNSGDGIQILNADSSGNVVQNNFIGTDQTEARQVDGRDMGNGGNGILVDGASENLIGGNAVLAGAGAAGSAPAGLRSGLAGNTVAYNGEDGVHVANSASGNSILTNSIHGNSLDGIALVQGGNGDLAAPSEGSYDAGTAAGSFAPGTVAAGSRVQLFSDSETQGRIYLGETHTDSSGLWSVTGLPISILPQVTATVTDAVTGNTSPFGTLDFVQSFTVTRRLNDAPANRTVTFADGEVLAVLPLALTASGADVVVASLTLLASGSLDETEAIAEVALWRDNDGDGVIGPGDEQLVAGVIYEADDGTAHIDLGDGVTVPAGEPQRWIIAYRSNGTAVDSQTFELELETPSALTAKFRYPAGIDALPQNPFPVHSDAFAIGTPANPFLAWRNTHFPDGGPEAEPEADPDGDAIPNALEFALGLDPRVPGVVPIHLETFDDRLLYTFRFPAGQDGVSLHPAASKTLVAWERDSSLIESVGTPVDQGDGTVTVTVTVRPNANGRIFLRLEADVDIGD